MEPNSHEPAPELPKPERVDPMVDEIELVSAPGESFEKQTVLKESLIKANDAVSQAIGTVNDDTLVAQQPTAISDDNSNNPSIADDVDVIEKEWVEKAKQIVAKTRDDPHAQSKQMNIFKHDYMKKRYGKEIKLPEERG